MSLYRWHNDHGIEVSIIEDTINGDSRLTTFQLKYPRIVHAEMLTHRTFSRNASSSRAIPVKKTIEEIRHSPAMPTEWGKNFPGMQSKELLAEKDAKEMEQLWREAANSACDVAERMLSYNAHKQIINRILEPYTFISVVVTATDYKNFFELRNHADADPTIRVLAKMMQEAYEANSPRRLKVSEWHLPYVTADEKRKHPDNELALASAARCARVSYKNHDGSNCNIEKDLALADKLKKSRHLSPFEHQAKPNSYGENNFKQGWMQHRYIVT